MAVNKIRLRSLADEGNKRAAMVLDITENHTQKMLSAILIGNNIVNISASSLATSLAYHFGLLRSSYSERLPRRIMQRSTQKRSRYVIFHFSSFL